MRSASIVLFALGLAACGRKIPDEVKPTLEAQRAAAIKVATDAVPICGAWEAPILDKNTPHTQPPANPAKGTSLESEAKVYEVAVMCYRPDPKDANLSKGDGLAELKGTLTVPVRNVTMPEDKAQDTCKDKPHNCEQVIVPSRFLKSEKTADLHVLRPTPTGWVEVTVVIGQP